MTQKEFTDRVEVEVTTKEFEAINEVYMNSDLDKDAFCRIWVKMNKSRVREARIKAAELREKQTLKEIAWAMYQRISRMENTHLRFAHATLSHQEKNFLYGIGVEITDTMNLSTVWHKLAQYLGIVK
jgi:hypothetical protein